MSEVRSDLQDSINAYQAAAKAEDRAKKVSDAATAMAERAREAARLSSAAAREAKARMVSAIHREGGLAEPNSPSFSDFAG